LLQGRTSAQRAESPPSGSLRPQGGSAKMRCLLSWPPWVPNVTGLSVAPSSVLGGLHARSTDGRELGQSPEKANVAGLERHYSSSAGSDHRFGLAPPAAVHLTRPTQTSDERLRGRPSCPTCGHPASAPAGSEHRFGLAPTVVPGPGLPSQTSHAHLQGRSCCPTCGHPTLIPGTPPQLTAMCVMLNYPAFAGLPSDSLRPTPALVSGRRAIARACA